MAIGSDGEIGVRFVSWGEMDEVSRAAWFEFMVEVVGADLVGGYGRLCWPDECRRGELAGGSDSGVGDGPYVSDH